MTDNGMSYLPTIEDMEEAIARKKDQIESDEEYRHELVEGHTSGNPMTLGPRLPSPEEWTSLQIKGAQDNAAKWLERVTKPKKNFKEEALKASSVERYHDSMARVLTEKSWEGGMENVNETETIDTIKRRGASVYSKGVQDREPKILRVNKEMAGDRLALAATIDGLPVATDADREAKMIANKRGLQAIGKARRGGA